jgi:hypothetical protein
MSIPTLSICVPSRNRQVYFQETIRALTASLRPDVEFVFADNSDDASIMDGFIADRLADPRIRYLPAAGRTLSMMDNWERSVSAATGRYVAFIGDDDYLDPDLAGFILNLERVVKADAIAWTGPNYIWPTPGAPARSVAISLGARVKRMAKEDLFRKAFLWEDAGIVPLSGFSIYHGALSRRLLDRIRTLGDGRIFEFPVVDYELGFKTVLLGETFIHSERPFSILGVCPLSNSAASGKLATERAALDAFNKDLGWDFNKAEWLGDMPFRTWHGLPACIYLIQHWLTRKIGMKQQGHEQNLVAALTRNCSNYRDREDFDTVAAGIRDALALWHDGRFLADFKPEFIEPVPARPTAAFSGTTASGMLHFPDDTAGVRTPGELFKLMSAVVCCAEDIPINAGALWAADVDFGRKAAAG